MRRTFQAEETRVEDLEDGRQGKPVWGWGTVRDEGGFKMSPEMSQVMRMLHSFQPRALRSILHCEKTVCYMY